MAQKTNTTWKTIPISQLARIINGPEVQEPVYYFGRTIKKQDIELPGKTYVWARGLVDQEED